MNTWAPLFSKIVDSSLWREDDLVVKVFLTMLAKKDADHVVRASAFMIGEWAKKTEAEVLSALDILAAPDTKRLEPQEHQGRRVEKVDGGWLILNGQFYEDLMRKANRREYKRQKQAEYRKGDLHVGSGQSIRQVIKRSVNNDPITKADQAAIKQKGWGEALATPTVAAEYDLDDPGDSAE